MPGASSATASSRVAHLPRDAADILQRVKKGSFDVHLNHRRLETTVNRLVLGILTAALFIHGMNKGWKRMARKQTPYDRIRFGPIPNSAADRMARLRRAFATEYGSSRAAVSTP